MMGNEVSTEVQDQSVGLIDTISRAALDPAVDAGKMKAMADLAIQLRNDEQQQQFNRDFVAACFEMPVITKAGRIIIPANREKGTPERIQGTFARFEDINRVVKPILDRHNLAITFELGEEGGKPACTPLLWHRNGFVKRGSTLSAPIDSSGSKNNTQGVGSTTSYLKRQTMGAALNLIFESEDDDGNGGRVIVPEERANLIMEEATAAFDDGRYNEWFKSQSPKDRGWLVTNGYHAQFGGQPALSAPVSRNQDDSKPPADMGAKVDGKPQSDEQAAADWARRYVANIAKTDTLDAMAELQERHKDRLDKIRTAYPAVWNDITYAHGAAYDRLSGIKDDSPATGDDLFRESSE